MDLMIDVDEIWKGLGTWGRYQKFQMVILFLNYIACAFHLLSTVMIGYRPPFQCQRVEFNCSAVDCVNNSIYIEYDKCEVNIHRNDTNQTFLQTQGCVNGYKYPINKDVTFVTEWDLVCQNEGFAEFTQTLVIVGQATGAAIFPQFSDRFGRKPVHIVANIGIFCVALGMSFSPSLTVFALLRYLVGTFQQGVVMTNYVLGLESLPRKSRFKAHILVQLSWTTGSVLLAPLGYLFRNTSWRYFQLTLGIYSAYSLSLYWTMDESLRWLIANGKRTEAEQMIRKIARWNRVNYDDVIRNAREKSNMEASLISKKETKMDNETETDCDDEVDSTTDRINIYTSNVNSSNSNYHITEEPESISDGRCVNADTDINPHEHDNESGVLNEDRKRRDENNKAVKKYTFLTILKSRKLLLYSLILWYTWIVDSLTYFGITLFSASLFGNRFLNFFLASFMDYIACFAEYMLLNRIGRKWCVIFFHAVTAMSLIAATLLVTFGNGDTRMLAASTAFTMIGKFGSAGSFGGIFLYTPELYPTNLRNVGIGVSSSISRLGGMLAPFAGPLAERIIWAPGAIFGTMCLLVTILFTILPETKKFELPQTLEEMDEWTKKTKTNDRKKESNKN